MRRVCRPKVFPFLVFGPVSHVLGPNPGYRIRLGQGRSSLKFEPKPPLFCFYFRPIFGWLLNFKVNLFVARGSPSSPIQTPDFLNFLASDLVAISTDAAPLPNF